MRVRTHRYTPQCQGDQGRGIRRLLGVNYCDSQQWAGGDWEAGIQRMRMRTHRDTPRRQDDSCEGLQKVLGFDDHHVLRRDRRVRVRGVDAGLVE